MGVVVVAAPVYTKSAYARNRAYRLRRYGQILSHLIARRILQLAWLIYGLLVRFESVFFRLDQQEPASQIPGLSG